MSVLVVETAPSATPLGLELVDLKLRVLESNVPKGLDTITRAIYETQDIEIGNQDTVAAAIKKYKGTSINLNGLSIQGRNQHLATLVHEQSITTGFISGWKCLVEAAPNMGLHPKVVEHVRIAVDVYERLRKGTKGHAPIDVKMSIGSQAAYDSIYRLGPKSLGGTAWRASEEYMAFLKNPAWSDSGYSTGIPPCVAMGWVGVQMKVTPTQDVQEVVRMQLLGTIDFDLDHLDENKSGFQSGFRSAAMHTRAVGTRLQGAALIGMINYDLQNYIRPIQNRWAAENIGPYNLGPADVSPQDWTAYLIADCAALVPFAYDRDYEISSIGMVIGMILLQCQDLLFDTGCSNRVATVAYVEAAGVAKYGIHAAYAIAGYEAIAKTFVDSLLVSDGASTPHFGYSACMAAGPWGPYGTRYRVWERCVKYIRQLKQSEHPEAKALLKLSSQDMMLRDYDPQNDIGGGEWARAMKSNASDLVSRPTVKYFIPASASELFDTPGVDKSELCEVCVVEFDAIMASKELEEVHAQAGLPSSVLVGTFGRPARLAVGLHRAALWATTSKCCDVCACRVGYWADAAAYGVLSALMHDEPLLGPSLWMLQNYFVGCITFWPVSLPFLLPGFDLIADLSFEDGAMGDRDVVDI
ncbi:uncharacterized protein LY89DRAFT_785515 [Mollisia scopiformis]|uniref:Uncharacterized protein n=1 Tax=Mollisia scopiformis TaxID=149040 RepID=A0A194WZE6_MOLSC|nr:uncharacterized protein LY89DRAFT_785515 [Mollisia scopiformis]KUJ12977.1 hypothetical protein LY89DRAFT_785515 [Mollisia scopiformis]